MRTLAILLLLIACRGADDWAGPEVSYDLVEVSTDKVVVKTGGVGHDKWKSEATYVLVEAKNKADQDLMIALSADLTDANGKVVGTTRRDQLRVPAGGQRLFALVDDKQEARPTATGAKVAVRGASTVSYPANVVVTDGAVRRDGARVEVAGHVLNNHPDRKAKAIVVFAFFDQAGRPMSRPSTVFPLDGKGKRGASMVGPDGSHSAYMFIGEVSY